LIWKSLKTFIRKRITGQKNADNLKIIQKQFYIRINRLVRYIKQTGKSDGTSQHDIQMFSVDNFHTFFGYYDKTPFSKDNSMLLAMLAPLINHAPMHNEEVELGYFNIKNNSNFYKVGKSSTWCWQQGCRLQWLPGKEDEFIIYNKLVNSSYGCCIQNVKNTKIIKIYENPIYDIDKTGQWGLSLNFSRLQRLRPGYGYTNLPDKTIGKLCPGDDGIWLIEMESGKKELIFSLDFLANFETLTTMKRAEHYINHISISPSCEKFMFFHLWVKDHRLYNRLIISRLDMPSPVILLDEGTVSHYTWKSKDKLLVTVNFDHKPSAYILFNTKTEEKKFVGDGYLIVDGHPSYSPNGELLLTDTYPDKYGEQHLLLFSHNFKIKELSKFFSPYRLKGETRCDLHPRWDRYGRYICFDSAHSGKRALYLMKLNSSNAA
jgi:hypothetical protein